MLVSYSALLSLLLLSVSAFLPHLPSTRQRCHYVPPRCVLDATKRRRRRQGTQNKGFGSSKETKEKNTPVTDKNIYSLPALYDLAFGYRSYEEEVDFLLTAHKLHSSSGLPPRRILELAAGPARHVLTALVDPTLTIEAATAVDSSPDMQSYAMELAKQELPTDKRDSFHYICSDMRLPLNTTATTTLFDSAWILLGSLQHLQTNQDVLDCFSSVHRVLQPGGTLVIELPHPRETFSMVECTKNGWEVPLEDSNGEECGELQIIWGDEDDTFDEISQVRQFTVSFDLQTPNKEDRQHVRQIVPMRLFTAQEIGALATCSGFEVVSMYGALDMDVAVNDGDEAFRLVSILRKV